jgi:hypothetical protein
MAGVGHLELATGPLAGPQQRGPCAAQPACSRSARGAMRSPTRRSRRPARVPGCAYLCGWRFRMLTELVKRTSASFVLAGLVRSAAGCRVGAGPLSGAGRRLCLRGGGRQRAGFTAAQGHPGDRTGGTWLGARPRRWRNPGPEG